MDCVETVGELKEALKQYPDDMPLRLRASCYEHNGYGRIYQAIKPDEWSRRVSKNNPDGSEEEIYPRLKLSVELVSEMDRGYRESRKSPWKVERRDCLEIFNDDPGDMVLD